jgi:glycerophosphoryl diester phosphodiesterase
VVPKRPKDAPGRWAKFAHLSPYSKNNSIAGLKAARKLGYTAIDLDFHMTADGIWANVHWGDLREHRIPGVGKTAADRFRLGRSTVRPVSRLPWSIVKTLRDSGGRRINSAQVMLAAAKRLGFKRVEIEPKDIPTVEQFKRLKKHADRYGIEVVVKRLTDIPGAAKCLANAHEAGLTTMVLPRSKTLPLAKFAEVDYVRPHGKLTWI